MAARLEEITATFLGERMRFANEDGDTIIGRAWMNGDANIQIAIKGQADIDELQPEQTYRFYGRWTNYTNKRTQQTEKQFAFQSFVRQQPHSLTGIVTYLKHAGEGLGFSTVRAKRCYDLYGSDAVKMLREQPEQVAAALTAAKLPLSVENARKIAARLEEDAALEGCTLDLMDLLTGRGFPKSTARLAVREWGNRAAQVIRRDPYSLMRFRSCGFKRCDALYLELKLPAGRLKRQALAAWYELASDTEGHTWYPLAKAVQGIKSTVRGAGLQPERALRLARLAGATAELRTDSPTGPITPDGSGRIIWIAEGRKSRNEEDLAERIATAAFEQHQWPDVSQVEGIDDHQREELGKALRGMIAILGGSPGTGKTYTLACLVKLLIRLFGQEHIGIGAPTGKAAVRVTENLARYGITLRARTWHSLLRGGPGGGFQHDERDPLPFKFLIGDESSMNDTDLTAAVFRARPAGCHVLLVGDVNQLPPVGHGAPLRDMIAAGLPYGELREIKRNSGGIVEACAAIRDGQWWEPGDNLILAEEITPERQIETMLRAIRQAASEGSNPIWDVQVVVPVNAKSPLARKALNKLLQQELNPNPATPGCPFKFGDKIVNTKNAFFPVVDADLSDEETNTNDRNEVYVANGELAEVVDVHEKFVVAKLSNPNRIVRIPLGKRSQDGTEDGDGDLRTEDEDKATGTGCSWDLGYALSCHKAQGAEFPICIVMLDEYPGAKMVCSREWLYTAISRARDKCILIGKKSVADAFCRKIALGKRKTLLKERILLEIGKRELAEL